MNLSAIRAAKWIRTFCILMAGAAIAFVGLFYGSPTLAAPTACPGNSSIPSSTQAVTVPEGDSATFVITPCLEPTAPVTMTLLITDAVTSRVSVSFSASEVVTQTQFTTTAPLTVTVRATASEATCEADESFTMVKYTTSSDPQYDHPYPESDSAEDRVHIRLASTPHLCMPTILAPPPPPTWRLVGGGGRIVDVLAVGNQSLYVGTRTSASSGGLFKGAGCAVGATSLLSAQSILDIAVRDQRALAGTFGLRAYYSNDSGDSWKQTSSKSMNPYVYGVVFTNSEPAYAGADDGVYSSKDAGATWTRMSSSTGSRPGAINILRFDAARNLIWIGTFGQGLWRLPVGTTAFQRNLDLASAEVWDVAWSGNRVFIATSNGVFEGDGLGPWQSSGFTSQQVLSLEVDGNTLYAGLRNGGVWQTALTTPVSWQQVLGGAGWKPDFTVRDLYHDPEVCQGLLAATNDGVWVLK